MSIGELLLTSVVVLLSFGPKQLPKLARHLGQLIAQIKRFQAHADQIKLELIQAQQLQENQIKAEQADAYYKNNHSSHHQPPLEVLPHE